MLVKVVAVQSLMGLPLSMAGKIQIFKQRPDFVCLPEYWLIDNTVEDHHRAAVRGPEYTEYLTRLSEELATCLVAGTIVEADGDRLYNTCFVINKGEVLGRYRKRFPLPGERGSGLLPGNESLVLNIEGLRVAPLICGDVFHPELYDELADHKTDIIFVPTVSPHRPVDPISEKKTRDRVYFLDGARRSGAFVVKVCGVGLLFGKPLQGRSLIAAPWGILNQIGYHEEASERILIETLDIDELRDFRRKTEACGRDRPSSSDESVNPGRRS